MRWLNIEMQGLVSQPAFVLAQCCHVQIDVRVICSVLTPKFSRTRRYSHPCWCQLYMSATTMCACIENRVAYVRCSGAGCRCRLTLTIGGLAEVTQLKNAVEQAIQRCESPMSIAHLTATIVSLRKHFSFAVFCRSALLIF
ncbi:hypothetical protein KP509_06G007000 [Ceratopteris richardii]|uniref:Uncharacterized protein n=1 Tax=Ceratopteris richardii TaxID=49495 RepID=A0A8T2ULL2_CERRI|nr:hypothetical protein KP509_06G007000 [Ceratopteris richardii]